jgi:hypothetical protein
MDSESEVLGYEIISDFKKGYSCKINLFFVLFLQQIQYLIQFGIS